MQRAPAWLLAFGFAAGCASGTQSRRVAAPVFRAHRPAPAPPGPASLVERALHQRGLRFGTDGSVTALYTYLANSHRRVSPARARPGDVVAFEIDEGCGDHLGLVEEVAPSGRITFREWRDGEVRRSFADPRAPHARRDEQGRVLNTFLRVKQPDDPADAHYFAGDMLCAVFRAER